MYINTLKTNEYLLQINNNTVEDISILKIKPCIFIHTIKIKILSNNAYFSTCQHLIYYTKNKESSFKAKQKAISYWEKQTK